MSNISIEELKLQEELLRNQLNYNLASQIKNKISLNKPIIKFKVEVNPFKRKAIINSKIGVIQYTQTMYYEYIDEWNSFEFGEQIFDIHFHYDAEFLVSIYELKENKVNYEKEFEVELIIKLID